MDVSFQLLEFSVSNFLFIYSFYLMNRHSRDFFLFLKVFFICCLGMCVKSPV